MSRVVDTRLILDVLPDDTDFGLSAAELIDRMQPEGLAISPVTYVELAPAFLGVKKRRAPSHCCVALSLKTETFVHHREGLA